MRSIERAASEAVLFRQLDAALGAVPFEQRSAFVLVHLQRLSSEEVGRMPNGHSRRSASARPLGSVGRWMPRQDHDL
jgi:DNA-directed RNA polymerase specialized sigma24 family protein